MEAIVITPVKNAIASSLQTIQAIKNSNIDADYIVFNDFSSYENKSLLEKNAGKFGFELIHLENITNNPSPNYKLVLQEGQKRAVQKNLPLILVESDVQVKQDTLEKLIRFNSENPKLGLVGAITTDEKGKINFPYLKFRHSREEVVVTKRSLSFCCTLISLSFLKKYDFSGLDSSKDWYDTFISQKAIELGFKNFILMKVPVVHRPHGSRPWKLLKYKNPFLYYIKKLFYKRDRI